MLLEAAIIAALFIQFPAAAFVWWDAKRRGLKQPVWYEMGIIMPVGGLLVFVYYVRNRQDLPRSGE